MVIKANNGSNTTTAPIKAQAGTPVQNCNFFILLNIITIYSNLGARWIAGRLGSQEAIRLGGWEASRL